MNSPHHHLREAPTRVSTTATAPHRLKMMVDNDGIDDDGDDGIDRDDVDDIGDDD